EESDLTHCLYVTSVLQEAKRCATKLPLPIYAFTGFEYFPLQPHSYYIYQDLLNSLRKSYDLGVNGAIIWSTSTNMTARCDGIGEYVEGYLGPEVSNLNSKHAMTTSDYNSVCEMKDGFTNYCCYENMKQHPSTSTTKSM
ncbi:unnamed protein product, partial [Cercopithifilaria johnstoni]